jgi:hypothetical protein
MKQQYVIIHWYAVLQEEEKTWLVMNGATLRHVMFCENMGRRNCFVEPTFWQNVIQLFSNAGILVWGIVWVVTNCCFMSDKLNKVPVYTMKACGRSNLSITWRGGEWSGSGPGCFTSGNESQYSFIMRRRVCRPLNVWMLWKSDKSPALMGIEPQFFDFSATSQVMCHTPHAVLAPN